MTQRRFTVKHENFAFLKLVAEIQEGIRAGRLPKAEALQTLEDLKRGVFSRAIIVDESRVPSDWTRPVADCYHKPTRKLLSAENIGLWKPSGSSNTVIDAMGQMYRYNLERPGIAALRTLALNAHIIPDFWKSGVEDPKYILFTGDVFRLSNNPSDKKRVFSLCWREDTFGIVEVPLFQPVRDNWYFVFWKPNATLPDAD